MFKVSGRVPSQCPGQPLLFVGLFPRYATPLGLPVLWGTNCGLKSDAGQSTSPNHLKQDASYMALLISPLEYLFRQWPIGLGRPQGTRGPGFEPSISYWQACGRCSRPPNGTAGTLPLMGVFGYIKADSLPFILGVSITLQDLRSMS